MDLKLKPIFLTRFALVYVDFKSTALLIKLQEQHSYIVKSKWNFNNLIKKEVIYPATDSSTTTLLRLRPNHQLHIQYSFLLNSIKYKRRITFMLNQLPGRDGRCAQSPSTYFTVRYYHTITGDSYFMTLSFKNQSKLR